MRVAPPNHFYPELSDARLSAIAAKLLDLRFVTLLEMQSRFDDNYTRETVVFGRTRNMLIDMAMRGGYEWMTLVHAGMDVTIRIGNIPCRYFRDDSSSPEKAGFFKRNLVDDLFATDDGEPVMWRFIVERALIEEDEDRVFFAGYNIFHEKVSEWVYSASNPLLHAIDRDVPNSTAIPSAVVGLRDDHVDDSVERKIGNGE